MLSRVKVVALNSPYVKRPKGQRTKSQRDLSNQLYRIVHLSPNADTDPRVDRAVEIASRYQRNMMATRQRNKDVMRLVNAHRQGDINAENKARKQIVDRQYSRRTYMGLTNG